MIRLREKKIFSDSEGIHLYSIYVYKYDLALNNQQWLICHKTQPTNQKLNCW